MNRGSKLCSVVSVENNRKRPRKTKGYYTKTANDRERLRQEAETFDLEKHQSTHLLRLQLVTGYSSLLLAYTIVFVASYILINSDQFSEKVVAGAGAALFVNLLGILAGIWKIILKPLLAEKFPRSKRDKDDDKGEK